MWRRFKAPAWLTALAMFSLAGCDTERVEERSVFLVAPSNQKADGPEPAGTRLRIASANLTTKGSYDSGEGARILTGLRPDVVLLQEFRRGRNTSNEHKAFVESILGEGASWFRESNVSLPNGILSRYPIIASGQWADPEATDRGFAWARIDIPGPTHLFAVSIHLMTRSAATRSAETKALSARIAEVVPKGDYLVIGGDFNTTSRSENAIRNLSNLVVTSGPFPRDGKGLDEDTNANRSKPYDWVLVNETLHALHTPVVLGSKGYKTGLVVDTRTITPIGDLAPALASDSGSATMQHMAVARDFLLPVSADCTPPGMTSSCSPSQWLTRFSLFPVDTLSKRARETIAILSATHWFFDSRYGFAPQLPGDYGFGNLESRLRWRLPHAISLFDLEQWRNVAIWYSYESPAVLTPVLACVDSC